MKRKVTLYPYFVSSTYVSSLQYDHHTPQCTQRTEMPGLFSIED